MNVAKADFSRIVRSSGISQEIVDAMWNELEFLAGKSEKFIIKVWLPADQIFTEKSTYGKSVSENFFAHKEGKKVALSHKRSGLRVCYPCSVKRAQEIAETLEKVQGVVWQDINTQEDFAKFFVGETAIAIREAVGL